MSAQVPQNAVLLSASHCAKGNWEGEGGSNGAAASSRFASVSLLLNFPSGNSCFPKSSCREHAVLKKRQSESKQTVMLTAERTSVPGGCLAGTCPAAGAVPGDGVGVWGSPQGAFQAVVLVPGSLVPHPTHWPSDHFVPICSSRLVLRRKRAARRARWQ